MCGDFNARTADSPDYVDADRNRHVDVLPDEYTADSNIRQRVSRDTVRPDSNGLLLLELCRKTGIILNGRTGNDANVGNYTYISSHGSSVIDYILASQNWFEFIQSFDVDGPNILTDHCCISLNLEFQLYDATLTVYQRTPDIAIDLSRKLGRGALRGQYFSVFSCKYLKILCK